MAISLKIRFSFFCPDQGVTKAKKKNQILIRPYFNLQNSDTLNLNDIDSKSIWLKHDRDIRKQNAYQFLRKLTREGCENSDRRLIWIKGTNASEKDMNRYKELTKTLFEGIEMQEFPQFPMFGSKCRFKTLSPESKYCARKILVVLAVEHDSLHYCPQLPFIVVERL
ncbi:hypothetical protein RFI_11057 [Reticulomyxa filosa]|uniref:Uncharacterized protein n=1 Tax=Reticulomyxa filosa TaxID=46433 RepID=X6NK28_RETFI|nr:hypothetical protein RFI_11057 [Reticulomyxa filosa]|eukprot:ETO26079.1 hypothetical protein RFI_11057 [Reticulomyxa filosa]